MGGERANEKPSTKFTATRVKQAMSAAFANRNGPKAHSP